MRELIYRSTAAGPFDRARIAQVLAQARRRNAHDAVTGVLLYSDASFLQVLEGDDDVVAATFARICADDRHHDIAVLHSGPIERRRHPGWAMGFHHLDDPLAGPGEVLDLARARQLVARHVPGAPS